MIDALAERYGKLPTEVLDKASTFDLQIYDIAVSYRNWIEKKSMSKDPNDLYKPDELEKMIKKSRHNG